MQRIKSFDIAKGLTIFLMPGIHAVMLYSNEEVKHSMIGALCAFIAEGPGAQLFMFLMGIGIVYSKRTDPKQALRRSAYLLLSAYLLNIVKFILPLLLDFIPHYLLSELGLTDRCNAISFFLAMGDILQFAAMAYIITFLLHKTKYWHYHSFVLSLMIIFFSPLLYDLHNSFPPFNYILNLVGGHPPFVFFPLFPWVLYPVMGLFFGYYLKNYKTSHVIVLMLIVGVIMITVSFVIPLITKQTTWLSFYRTEPSETLYHAGFILIWLAAFYFITENFRRNNFSDLLIWCSRHITIIYFVQWILIFWLFPIFGYGDLSFLKSINAILFITLLTFYITWIINLILYESKKEQPEKTGEDGSQTR